MTNENSRLCWQILTALVDTFDGYSIDLEQVKIFMTKVEDAVIEADL